MKKENKTDKNNDFNLNENRHKLFFLKNMAFLGRVTAGIAHEINTHLAITMSAIEELTTLVEEYKLSLNNKNVLPEDHDAIIKDMTKYLKVSLKAIEKTAKIVKAVKGHSPDYNENNTEAFNVSMAVIDTINLFEFKIKKSLCKIEKSLDEKIMIYGNQKSFRQIVANLIDNALDACKNAEGLIKIKLIKNMQNEAELIIEDNGEVISPENFNKIFNPFFTTKPFEDSSGLGLNIVKDAVDRFKGQIFVQSNSDLTVFTVKIPVFTDNC